MEKALQHITGVLPPDYQPRYKRLLFNEDRHRALQSNKAWQSFYLLNTKNKRLLAEFHACKVENEMLCPAKGPFAGLEFDQRLSQERLHNFVHFISENVRKEASGLVVKPRPAAYDPSHFSREVYAWLSNGFQVVTQEIHGMVNTNEIDISDILAGSEVNRLNKCRNAGYKFSKCAPGEYGKIHQHTLKCREERGQRLSMSEAQLGELIGTFPDKVWLFSVRNGAELIATAICILVKKDVLYNYSHAHGMDYDDHSPVVFLMDGLYRYCQKNGIKMIDVGSSSLNHSPNFPLLAFKERLGADLSIKLQLEKKFS